MARKTQSVSFSLPEGSQDEIEKRARALGFDGRSDYLRALREADEFYGLRATLDPVTMQRVLRISAKVEGQAKGDRSSGKSDK